VFAVELDPLLVRCLRTTIARNGFQDRIGVIAGNALTAELPRGIDVIIAEMIDTGLLDELQVPVLNALHERGVIGPRTRIIPERYATSIDLVAVDDDFYGFRFANPIHAWPVFMLPGSGWHPWRMRPLTERVDVSTVDFRYPVTPLVTGNLTLPVTNDGLANAIRISGVATLVPGRDLGATNALNGDKILMLPDPIPVRAGSQISCHVRYVMGGGLGTFTWRQEQ
jgi:hypothetical protein